MKRKNLNSVNKLLKISSKLFLLLLLFSSCRKDSSIQDDTIIESLQKIKDLPIKTNPFSIRNVKKAKVKLASQSKDRITNNLLTGNEKQFVYFKFNPQDITQEQFLALENDSTLQLMEIPFANIALYSEEFALDSTKAEQQKDGNIYGVTSIENTNVFTKLSSRSETQMQYLDTLLKIAETDTALQYQAFREAGVTEQQISRLRICLFKRPHGFVNYFDNQMGSWERVRGM